MWHDRNSLLINLLSNFRLQAYFWFIGIFRASPVDRLYTRFRVSRFREGISWKLYTSLLRKAERRKELWERHRSRRTGKATRRRKSRKRSKYSMPVHASLIKRRAAHVIRAGRKLAEPWSRGRGGPRWREFQEHRVPSENSIHEIESRGPASVLLLLLFLYPRLPSFLSRSVSRSRALWNFAEPFNSCQELESTFLKRKDAVSRVNRLLSVRLVTRGKELLLEVLRMILRKSRILFRSFFSIKNINRNN